MKTKKSRIIILSILIVVALFGIIWGSSWLKISIDNFIGTKNTLNDFQERKFNGQSYPSMAFAYQNYNIAKFNLISIFFLYASICITFISSIIALILTLNNKMLYFFRYSFDKFKLNSKFKINRLNSELKKINSKRRVNKKARLEKELEEMENTKK